MIHPLAAVRGVPRRTWLRWRFAYLVLLPTLILFTFLRVVPTVWAFVMSLFDWGLVKPAEKFEGLNNYIKLLSDKNFQTAFFNTTIFAVFFATGQTGSHCRATASPSHAFRTRSVAPPRAGRAR